MVDATFAAIGLFVSRWQSRREARMMLVAIEVTSGPQRRTGLQGLEAFAQRFQGTGPLRCWLVGPGGIPLNEFLSAPAAAWFEEA